MDQDLVFKALGDGSRRKLLDALFQEDGQTLTELQAQLPMTRFGAMKHLNLLEEAGLITTRKVGREKFHYLNPVPIQQVYDRWVTKYSRGWTRGLTHLKDQLEGTIMGEKHSHVYSIFIQTTPEKLWQALTDGDTTQRYYFGTRIQSDWKVGAPYSYRYPDGGTVINGGTLGSTGASMIEGDVLEYDPPKKLVTTFKPLWLGDGVAQPVTKVTFEIEPRGAACKLTLIHDDLEAGSPVTQGMIEGWAQIFSNLKTLLETGEPMPA